MVVEITGAMTRLIDEYQPALVTEARRLAAANIQFQSDPVSQKNQFIASLTRWHTAYQQESERLTIRAWGNAQQSEDGTYQLSGGQVWQAIEEAESAHGRSLASAYAVALTSDEYLRAKDRAASLIALYRDEYEFMQAYKLADSAVKLAIQESHGTLIPAGWHEARFEIESERGQRIGLDTILSAHNRREDVYRDIEACYAATRAMSSIFGAEFGISILTESILDQSLIGVVAPPSIRFVGSDALLAFQRGVARTVDYTQHNGNPELRFRFSRRVWGMKQVGNSWMIVG